MRQSATGLSPCQMRCGGGFDVGFMHGIGVFVIFLLFFIF
jgi:hypothetical protein